jgi:hypothetical protein
MKTAIIAVELAAIGNQSGGFMSFPVWEAIPKWMAYSIPACSAHISSQGRLLVVMLWFYRARKARHEGDKLVVGKVISVVVTQPQNCPKHEARQQHE